VLRSKIEGRIRFNDEERRSLVSAAVAMGNKLMRQVVTIVTPDTILKWRRQLERQKWDYSKRPRRPGRPRKPGEIEALVCRMARENTWGYRRIQGELAKLGITVSESCVADILRKNGLPPSPERGGLTWREFLSRHADVMLCADFFTKEVWTLCGLQRAFVLFVMHVRTRTILLAEATFSPRSDWMAQQVRNLMWECDKHGIKPRLPHPRPRRLLLGRVRRRAQALRRGDSQNALPRTQREFLRGKMGSQRTRRVPQPPYPLRTRQSAAHSPIL